MTNDSDCLLILCLAPSIAYLLRWREFLELEGILHVLERTSFPFVEGYLATKITLEFDWSAVLDLDSVPDMWDTEEVH